MGDVGTNLEVCKVGGDTQVYQKREFLEQLLEFDFRFRFERFYISKPISKTLYKNQNILLNFETISV